MFECPYNNFHNFNTYSKKVTMCCTDIKICHPSLFGESCSEVQLVQTARFWIATFNNWNVLYRQSKLMAFINQCFTAISMAYSLPYLINAISKGLISFPISVCRSTSALETTLGGPFQSISWEKRPGLNFNKLFLWQPKILDRISHEWTHL